MKGLYGLTEEGNTDIIGSIQHISKDTVKAMKKLILSAIETNIDDFAQPRNSYEEDGCVSFFYTQRFGKEVID